MKNPSTKLTTPFTSREQAIAKHCQTAARIRKILDEFAEAADEADVLNRWSVSDDIANQALRLADEAFVKFLKDLDRIV